MRIQSVLEEKLNAWSHGLGAIFGVVALILLIIFDTKKTDYSLTSVVIYGFSIIILFSASTFYHAAKNERKKHFLRVVDHISIYLLIAGTYTPVLLITLEQSLGWTLFYIVWGIAAFGVILKLFFTGRFEIFSTLLYLAMGWLIVFDFSTLTNLMHNNGILLLSAGGVAYTAGIIFYVIEKIPFNHVIWHLFVLAGAICHFFMIFLYVI
ncbi:PAQR family membrane homeostasis protein TrhA [Hyunsoonleella pacifica]|uniref:Hemolysin III family protein n=1 Tax=Hyunsoonleella pacifica TaxID=1080224 RepID=A0A4Q9FTY4_9FLAO|nr:hemolysin III family protein [Hyunsoonleella pacifica]TBN19120.1 hemolysin III family protein [Hyunsoonleella pacifica]GGD07478.1 hemolysin III family protein [Hyunsoonleella pacifica]